jgi:peptidoglycan/xylan/chitin deacetylase (PgdA/CDA1 family)
LLLKTAFSLSSRGQNSGNLSLLIFHRVLPRPDPLFPSEPDRQRFDQLLAWLKSWFNILPLGEACQRLQNKTLPARAAAITFDDGYADNFEHAVPLLQKHGVHATFFIATGFLDGGRMWNDTIIESIRQTTLAQLDADFLGLGRLPLQTIDERRAAISQLIPAIKHLSPEARASTVASVAASCQSVLPDNLMLSTDQLRALRRTGMGVGAHTVSHPILTKTDAGTARREISDSRERLQAILGERIGLFAYPNGKLGADYDASHVEMVRSLGFDAAVTTNPGVADAGSDRYALPRFTPWDSRRGRFGLRLLLNMRPQSATDNTIPH